MLRESSPTNEAASAAESRAEDAVPDYYYVLIQTCLNEESGVYVVYGTIVAKQVKGRDWDQALRNSVDFFGGKVVIGRGRVISRKHEIEMFAVQNYKVVREKLPEAYNVTLHNSSNPPSLYPGLLRSQRSINQRLTDVTHFALNEEYDDEIDFALLCGSGNGPILILVVVDRGPFGSECLVPDTLMLNGCQYLVVGFVHQGEPFYEAPDEILEPYLQQRGGEDYVEWSKSDRRKQAQEALAMQAEQLKRKRERRNAQKKRQRKRKTSAQDLAGEHDVEAEEGAAILASMFEAEGFDAQEELIHRWEDAADEEG